MSDYSVNSIATHLHLPGWWVRAYDAAMTAEASGMTAMRQAYAAGVAPALSSLELNSLAMVLANLQEQIIAGRYRDLRIDAEEHLKHAGTVTRSRRFVFEKIVQLLVGLRLLSPGEDGVLTSYSPVLADRWRCFGDGDEFEIGVTLNPVGAELLLGLGDAHSDLVRFAMGQPEAAQLLRGMAPLTIWRSVWLELAGAEQLVYLRLERGMQWEFRYLQLEGVFGMPLAELFAGLQLPEQRGAELGGELARRLKFVGRLGRKLVDQGFLATGVNDQYLAYGGNDEHLPTGVMTVWQASRERLAADATLAYRRAVGAAIWRGWFDQIQSHLARLCLHGVVGSEVLGAADQLWRELRQMPTGMQALPLEMQPGQLLLPQALFYEFSLRAQPGSSWPLPSGVVTGPLGELTRDMRAPDAVQRCERFWALVEDNVELQQALREEPMMTLASAATRSVAEVAAALRQRLAVSGLPPSVDAPVVDAKPRLLATDETVTVPAPRPAPEKPARPAAVSGALAARMLKTASDELAKMKANDLSRYNQLKRAYLESLDETSRRLLLDVQKRIQPNLFDEQLRQRLVRYMVDNPGAWRSADVTKTGNN